MGYPVALSNSTKPLTFLMVLASDHITGATGKTPTVTISKNGAAFAAPVGSVSEIGDGLYALAANATDANTLGPLLLHATATACDPRDDTFDVVNYNPASVHPYSPPTTATFGTTTALEIVTGAFDIIGMKAAGEALGAAEAQDGLRRLNNMVASWSLQPGTMLSNVREEFALTAGTGGPGDEYTMGPGGDFDTVRPVYLTGAGLLLTATTPNVEIPLGLVTDDGYQRIPIKTLASTYPTQVYYNPTAPLAKVALYPVPSTSANLLVLYSLQAVSGFADLTTQYAFAPGYQEAFEYNLAKRLQGPYGLSMSATDMALASDALKWIKTGNRRLVDAQLDAALTASSRGVYNILSDTPQ